MSIYSNQTNIYYFSVEPMPIDIIASSAEPAGKGGEGTLNCPKIFQNLCIHFLRKNNKLRQKTILYKSYIWEFNKCEVKWKVFNKLMTTLKRQLVFHGRCNFILSINHNVRQVLFQCGWSIPRNINLLRYPQSCYFETFWWLSKRDSLRKKCYSELFWSECGKMRTRITLKADTLSAVINVKRDYL